MRCGAFFGKRRKSSAPHGAELPSPDGGSRACRTPECTKLCSRPRQLRLCRMRCGASSAREERAPHRMEESFHPPTAAAEHAALRSARSFARAHGSSGSAGWGAERLQQEDKELRTAWSRASIPRRRQQSMPHSGVREALLAPTAAPAPKWCADTKRALLLCEIRRRRRSVALRRVRVGD